MLDFAGSASYDLEFANRQVHIRDDQGGFRDVVDQLGETLHQENLTAIR